MKRRFVFAMAMMIAAVMVFGSVGALAIDYDVPEGSSTKTARFFVTDDFDAPGVEFSMISDDDELVIHVNEDTIVYFEDLIMVRDVLEGDQTLAEVLNDRRMTVTYAVTTRSIPPQTSPISIKVWYEQIVTLPIDIEPIDIQPGGNIPFGDVSEIDWFYNAVVWCFNNDIMAGISPTEFAPQAAMTRAMLVTVLWRYAGSPASGNPAFGDVANNTWYSTAVAWAATNGIVSGFDANTFGPSTNVNREQMYTILHRYMGFAGITAAIEDEMRVQFADEGRISDWASEALHFMFDAGIMFREHDMDRNARPQENAIRGEIATAMYFLNRHAGSQFSQ